MATSRSKLTDEQLEAMRRDYEAGILTVRALAGKYEISAGRISQLAAEHGWKRTLTDRIEKARTEKLNKAQAATLNTRLNSVAPGRMEEAIVEAAAEVQADIVQQHAKVLGRGRAIAESMLGELEVLCREAGRLEELTPALLLAAAEGDPVKTRMVFDRIEAASSLAGRVKTLKDVADILGRFIPLERQAGGIDERQGVSKPFEEALKELHGQ